MTHYIYLKKKKNQKAKCNYFGVLGFFFLDYKYIRF